MVDIIQTSKCVDDVRAQHWVNMLNKKFTITRSVCSPSSYVANDNFIVQVDICKRIKKLVHVLHLGRYFQIF